MSELTAGYVWDEQLRPSSSRLRRFERDAPDSTPSFERSRI